MTKHNPKAAVSAPMQPASTASPAADRLELLQTFVRIVDAGSLSAAAAQMGTTQPTVSRRLQMLEKTMGARLLQRSTHAMKLTEDGERCYERAKDVLAGWDAFESDLRGVGVEASGTLRVVVPHAFGQQQLIAPLTRFMHAHPKISIEWMLHTHISSFIAEGIDCAIQVGEVFDDSLVAIKLAEVPRTLAAAPSLLQQHQLNTVADLADMPWLAIPAYYRRQVSLQHKQTGEKVDVAIKPRLISDNVYALANAAIEGLGVTLVSSWLMREHIEAGRLQVVLPEWQAATLPVYIVYPYARFYPARLRQFVALMREAVPQVFESTGAGTI